MSNKKPCKPCTSRTEVYSHVTKLVNGVRVTTSALNGTTLNNK